MVLMGKTIEMSYAVADGLEVYVDVPVASESCPDCRGRGCRECSGTGEVDVPDFTRLDHGIAESLRDGMRT